MSIMVSIVTTAYNHEKYIAEALESFLQQKTEYEFEILVHDDASKDNTPEIIRKYADKYPDKIRTVFQSENQHSKGIDVYSFLKPLIRGKYIAQCEGDDFWCDKYKIQTQVSYMESHPECAYCFCNSYKVNLKSEVIGTQTPVEKSRIFSSREIIAAPEVFLATAGIMYRWEDAKKFPQEFLAGEAGDIPLRNFLMLQGSAYGFEERMCCYRVMTPGSWSDRYQKEMQNDIQKFLKKNEVYIQYYKKFDQYTNGIYHKEIQPHINERLCVEYCLKKDWKKLHMSPVKEVFDKYPLKYKGILFVKYYFPFIVKVYRLLRYGKKGLRKL